MSKSELKRLAVQTAGKPCKVCGGNDGDMPCAYPGDKQPGCLRDLRLAREDAGLQPRRAPTWTPPK